MANSGSPCGPGWFLQRRRRADIVAVHQIVHSLDGKVILDRMVKHLYVIENGLIRSMEIDESGTRNERCIEFTCIEFKRAERKAATPSRPCRCLPFLPQLFHATRRSAVQAQVSALRILLELLRLLLSS